MNERAYAKINRFLHITGKRADGYHTLRSVMQTVTLFDELTYVPAGEKEEGFRFSCSDVRLETEENLCVAAARAFFGRTGIVPSGHLYLEKHIPCGAGLGGGSADAAAVLRLLQRRFGNPLRKDELHAAAAELGADVPFCLYGGKALCEGIGEVLTPLPDGKEETVVLVRGHEGLSTAEMYRRLDRCPFACAQDAGDVGNDFEQVAFEMLPEIRKLRDLLLHEGASEAMMSGSGSAVFGIFSTREAGHLAADRLRRRGDIPFVACCRTAGRV